MDYKNTLLYDLVIWTEKKNHQSLLAYQKHERLQAIAIEF